MKTFIRITPLCLAFGLTLLVAINSHAEEDNPWARPTCTFAMPYIGHAVQRNQTGLINDLFKAVFKREGVIFRHKAMPYVRAVQALREGKAQCSLDVGERKNVLHSKTVFLFYDLSVAYMRGTPWKDIQSLKDQKVAFLHGFDIRQLLPVEFSPQQVYDLTSAFHMLDRDFAKYILDDKLLLKDALFESRLPAYEFEIKPIKSFMVRAIFQENDEGRKLRDIFDRRIREMLQNGEFSTIMGKYDQSDQTDRIAKANGL